MKGTTVAIGLVLVVVIFGVVFFLFFSRAREAAWEFLPGPSALQQTTTTPQEGPNNDSAGEDQTSFRVHLNEGASALDITVLPLEVIEDSRCPMEVQCVWAGTVKVRAMLRSASGESVEVFELGKAITTETRSITLSEVLPVKRVTNVVPQEYEFVFEVKKRTDI